MEKNLLWEAEGKICAFTGYRPAKMPFPSEEDPNCILLKQRLKDEIYTAIAEGCTDFLCGMALGTDTWAAEQVLEIQNTLLGIKPVRLHAYIPFLGQDARWSSRSRKRYRAILDRCDSVTVIADRYTPSCMESRNEAMIRRADRLIAVYDGKKGGTANTIRLANEKGIALRILSPLPPRPFPGTTEKPAEPQEEDPQISLF